MSNSIEILGAGLAGLITACHFKSAEVFEAAPRAPQHRALLRFRGESVSKLTGIPFKPVKVDKAVVYGNQQYQGTCPIRLANLYSFKVTGQIGSRSIMKLESGTRYIAPEDFYDQLIDKVGENRINFDHPVDALVEGKTTISTIPMQVMMKIAGLEKDQQIPFAFCRQPITVHRFKVDVPCDVYQTIYFPDHELRTYRASITGDTVIVEMVNAAPALSRFIYRDSEFMTEVSDVIRQFGLSTSMVDWSTHEQVDQRYGKIVDIPDDLRHAVLLELTMKHNVFSIGRFACWRNILLDDVAEDVLKVDQLVKASDYSRFKIFNQK